MAKKVSKNILNYRVIIEKEYYDDGKVVYSASCPTLSVFDYGDSIDKVLASIKDGIEGVIEFLTEKGREIPVDRPDESIVTFTEVKVPPKSEHLIAA
jgi:predicted RNase H-like HicB family nuclease